MYFNHFAEAYPHMLRSLLEHGRLFIVKDQTMKELMNYSFSIKPPKKHVLTLFTNSVRQPSQKYFAAELVWYLNGHPYINFIKHFSKFWESIANNGWVNSNYGYLLFRQPMPYGETSWEYARERLIKDRHSRQAIIYFNTPEHTDQKTKDFPCTMYGSFHIRSNKLYLTIHMRSSDMFFGIPYDIPFFQLLQILMLRQLKWNNNWRTAKKFQELDLGPFTFFTNNLHIYYDKDEQWNSLVRSLESSFNVWHTPEIKLGLIKENGLPTNDMEKLSQGLGYEGPDKFYQWLNTEITEYYNSEIKKTNNKKKSKIVPVTRFSGFDERGLET